LATPPIVLRSREVDDGELRQMIHAAVSGRNTGDVFFDQFEYHFDENPFLTLTRGETLLEKCKEVAPNEYAKLHKGTPFYWLARAAFQVHDYETAAFYIDAAVSDDLRAADERGDDRSTVSTPAILFFLIDESVPEQASIDLVKILRSRFESTIARYNQRIGVNLRTLTFSDIQNTFLRPATTKGSEHLRTLVTAFISFILEWEQRSRLLELRTEPGTAEPFFLHLFKGCVLFESLLRAKDSKSRNKLDDVLSALHSDLGFTTPPKIGPSDFQTIVNALTTDDDSIFSAIKQTGRIRNATGHNLGWAVSLNGHQYTHLAKAVASSCLHALACLYR
jgi:hypothetical protein